MAKKKTHNPDHPHAEQEDEGIVQAPAPAEKRDEADATGPGADDEEQATADEAVPKRRAPPAVRSQGGVAPRAEPSTHGKRRQSGDRQQR